MTNNTFQPRPEEFPKLSEEQIKEEELIIEHGAWVFHFSYGYPLLILPR